MKLFNGRKLRAAWDKDGKTWWVSVIDVIAALRDCDYDTARNYWKQQKFRMGAKLGRITSNQLKFRGKDGKQRFTDVMRYKDIVKLVQKLPMHSASGVRRFREFIGGLAADSEVLCGVFGEVYDRVVLGDGALLRRVDRRVMFRKRR